MHEDRVVRNWSINEVGGGGGEDEGINCSCYKHQCHHQLEEKEHARNLCRHNICEIDLKTGEKREQVPEIEMWLEKSLPGTS